MNPLRSFLTLWIGQALSLVGSQAVQFGLIWWLTRETGSASVLATAALLGLTPPIVLGPIIGTLVDRWNRKRVMFVADAFVAVSSAVLAWSFWAGGATVTQVMVILFLRALGGAFHSPAMLASTSLMVPEEHLTRIQGLNQMLQGGLTIVSAPLGGLLLALLPMGGLMLVDVGTALFALIPLVFIRVPQPAAKQEASTLWQDSKAGFGFLRQHRGHLALVGVVAGINLFLVPAFSLLPLLILDSLGGSATQLGWITSTFGIGSIAGGILLGVWGGFKRRILTSLAALPALGLATMLLGLTPEHAFLLAATAMFLVGALATCINGPIQAVFQATVPPELQGRVFTLLGSIAGAVAPLGLILAAPVAETLGVRAWYLAAGLSCALLGMIAFFLPSVVGIEDSEDSHENEDTRHAEASDASDEGEALQAG